MSEIQRAKPIDIYKRKITPAILKKQKILIPHIEQLAHI